MIVKVSFPLAKPPWLVWGRLTRRGRLTTLRTPDDDARNSPKIYYDVMRLQCHGINTGLILLARMSQDD